jgi:Ran GTPase-activating protein (RanGAP) involved in mRNA processing and transport
LLLFSTLIGAEGARFLSEALEVNNTTLTKLNLGYNRIGDEGAAALAAVLHVNASLSELDLNKNDIGAAGAAALIAAVPPHARGGPGLATLNLSHNAIGAAGASALAEALRENTTITELGLVNCDVGDEGAAALAEALEVNTSLSGLDLPRNSIGTAGASALAEGLRGNSVLHRLTLYSNSNIGRAGEAAIDAAVKANPWVTVRLTPSQRFAFLAGCYCDFAAAKRLPLDIVRRILTRYPVAQGRRVWDGVDVSVPVLNF